MDKNAAKIATQATVTVGIVATIIIGAAAGIVWLVVDVHVAYILLIPAIMLGGFWQHVYSVWCGK